MQRNKIVSKKVRPRLLALSAAVVVMLICVAVFNKKATLLEQKHQATEKPVRVFNIVVASFIAYFITCSLIPLYRNANKFASESATKYLEKLMMKNPELKQYKSVLQNPNAMTKIATKISNELRESEQKRILELVNKIELDSTEEQIEKIHDEIAKVIEEHSVVHPEFLDHVYGYLVNADYMMFVKQKQQENKIKTR